MEDGRDDCQEVEFKEEGVEWQDEAEEKWKRENRMVRKWNKKRWICSMETRMRVKDERRSGRR